MDYSRLNPRRASASTTRGLTRSAELIGRTARLAARAGMAAQEASASLGFLSRALRAAEGLSARRALRNRARCRARKVAAWQRRHGVRKARAREAHCAWSILNPHGFHATTSRAGRCFVKQHRHGRRA